MPFMIVRQTVKDFEKWDEIFHSTLKDMQASGQTGYHILLNVDDPHQVVALYEIEDIDRMRAKARDEVSNQVIQDSAGITGIPEISFFDEVECSGSLCGM